MTVYKRSLWKLFTSLILAPLAPLAVFFIIMWLLQFFPYEWLYYTMYILPIVIFLLILYMTIWSDNIRFIITKDKMLEYYKRGKLVQTFDLATTSIGYHHVQYTSGGTQKLSLKLIDSHGATTILDCEPLGSSQFHRMFEEMERCCKVEPQHLDAK